MEFQGLPMAYRRLVGRGRRRQQVSRQLRRTRLLRRALSTAFGLVVGFCLAELISQFGLAWLYRGSRTWWSAIVAGIVASLALSVGRSVVGQLRVQLAASRAGYLSLFIIAVGLAATYPTPSDAQAASVEGVDRQDCDIAVSQGDAAPVAFLETSPNSPLDVDPSNNDVFRIDWSLPAGVEGALTMEIQARLGYRNVSIQSSGDDSGVYLLRPTRIDVPPGVYKVTGELRDEEGRVFCEDKQGFVRVLGSPASKHGVPPALGLFLGLAGAGFAMRFPRFDLWTFTTPDGLTIDVVDPKDGKTVRGPLLRGHMYVAKTTIDFPDPDDAYIDLPEAIEVSVGALSSAGSLATSQMQPANNKVSAESSFTVPLVGETLELVTDVSVAGNVIQSVRLVETLGSVSERTRIGYAIGQVSYKSASWTAADLCSMRRSDATVMLHGNADGSAVEAWTYKYDPASGRRTGRHRIELEVLTKLSDDCRSKIVSCIETGWRLNNSDSDNQVDLERERDDAVRDLAITGANLRAELLGDTDLVAPFDGVVQVAHDTEVTGSATFPWSVLYEGSVPADDAAVCFDQHPDGHVDHGPDIACISRFWGLSYEVAWPNGWVPTGGTSERLSFTPLSRVFRRTPKISLANLIRNRNPLLIHSIENGDFEAASIETDLLPSASVERIVGKAAFAGRLDALTQDAEVLHLFGHGRVANDNFALALDPPSEQLLDGANLLQLADGERFERGPLVVLNACDSGAISENAHNGLVDALRAMGARAVVVTETRVDIDEAAATATNILNEVLAGEYVSLAVRSARRESMYEGRDLSSFSYTFYGPCGLRMTNPIV